MSKELGSVYIHTPFCRQKCHYCDFVSYGGIEGLIPSYVEAVGREARGWAHFVTARGEDLQPLKTLYFGGGTPSLLSPAQVKQLIGACAHAFGLAEEAEITMEANPGTIPEQSWRRYLQAGVNRLSLGIQSFHDDELRLLGRIHSVRDAHAAYHSARQAGHQNINLDLIYGLPKQTLPRWRASLSTAVELEPEHLSLYSLTLSEETPLCQAIAQGTLPSPDPDLAAEMYELAEDMLEAAGYQHYEISNWARPGHQCRHNLTYWYNQPYLGLGAGAHSCLACYRFHNTPIPSTYVETVIRSGWRANVVGNPLLEECEPIDQATEIAETIMLGLRLGEGVNPKKLEQRFGHEVLAAYQPQIDYLCEMGLLEWNQDFLRLTPRGRLLGNEVFVRFLPVSPFLFSERRRTRCPL